IGYLMINGNGGKCKSTANKYALSATDLPGEHLALMESGNTLMALLMEWSPPISCATVGR
ncbi:hypothetical protein AB0187_27940, partial [Klebsiella pneumoniae]|uniref:hypothetical protein n=1 Tax=Klebsiella pneumoniae TaxID=573 RepID=UPI001BCE2462